VSAWEVGREREDSVQCIREHLKTAAFSVEGHQYEAIEQNPEKPADGDSWLAAVIKSCNSRTQRATGSWRSLLTERSHSTVLARSNPEARP